jgi:regulation of enolase protein 1 (concanavalin A-like superfamily)
VSLPSTPTPVPWSTGTWLRGPAGAQDEDGALVLTAAGGTDLWRTTSYGFVHDSAPALLTPLPAGSAVEVDVLVDLPGLYDQAGLLVRVDETTWTKAGLEVTDGAVHLGAVVTRGSSDWSMAPVPEWAGTVVTVRASRDGDALVLRARTAGQPWRMLRVAPLDPAAEVAAGPFCAAPTTGGLAVRFTGWRTGPADADLHAPGLA